MFRDFEEVCHHILFRERGIDGVRWLLVGLDFHGTFGSDSGQVWHTLERLSHPLTRSEYPQLETSGAGGEFGTREGGGEGRSDGVATEVGSEIQIDHLLCGGSHDNGREEFAALLDGEGDLVRGGGLGGHLLAGRGGGEGHVTRQQVQSAHDSERRGNMK